jgi:hypothetical protein
MLIACAYRNPLSFNDQRVATVHDQHAFAEMQMFVSSPVDWRQHRAH